jgi:hypothetical protein
MPHAKDHKAHARIVNADDPAQTVAACIAAAASMPTRKPVDRADTPA